MKHFKLSLQTEAYGSLPYCFFSTFAIDDSEPPQGVEAFVITQKLMDEGVFKVSRNATTQNAVLTWLTNFGAHDVYYINTVYLQTLKGIDQFMSLTGDMACEEVSSHPHPTHIDETREC